MAQSVFASTSGYGRPGFSNAGLSASPRCGQNRGNGERANAPARAAMSHSDQVGPYEQVVCVPRFIGPRSAPIAKALYAEAAESRKARSGETPAGREGVYGYDPGRPTKKTGATQARPRSRMRQKLS